jgi:asparagine synthase (glutamine-hydrolysing)
MPGISLRYNLKKKNLKSGLEDRDELFLEASNSIIYNNYYQREVLLTDPCQMVCTRYPEYPVKIFENQEFWACLEGKIYGKHGFSLQNEISTIIDLIFKSDLNKDKDKRIIASWLLRTDGDFVIYILDKKTNDFFIMNDVLGRLPLYYYSNDGELIVSREIRLMSYLLSHNNGHGTDFDIMGIAQFLLFSHTLNKRTLLNQVSKLEPGTILRTYNKISKFKIHTVHVFNFDDKAHANNSIKKNAKELIPLFLDACKNRVDQKAKNIISLSGGLDSRAVAAGLRNNKIVLSAVTSPEPAWRPVVGNLSETSIAEELASELKIECENYDIMIPKATDILNLLNFKNGLVYLAHSFLPRFLQNVKDKNELSPINFFTGHGGDISFANLLFNVRSVESWARSIVRVKGRLPLAIVSELTGVSEAKIIEELKNIFIAYPERDLSLKNAHFLFFENNAKFSFEIEDVNRFYFWTVAPFYSVPFFTYIFNCSDKDKERLELYREFLYELSPEAASIDVSNWSSSIISVKFRILQYILYLSFKYRKLRSFIKKIYDKRANSYQNDSKIIECIRQQVKDCFSISNLLTIDTVEKLLKNSSEYDHLGIDNLFTITSLLEQSLCRRNTINNYY